MESEKGTVLFYVLNQNKTQLSKMHSNFFSSLKQVEKRLKLENPPPQPSNLSPPPPPVPVPVPDGNYTSTQSLSSPIYLHFDQPSNNNSTLQESSESPLAFLSCSLQLPPTQQNLPQITQNLDPNDDIDDIEQLIQLLGLSDCYEQGNQEEEEEQEEEEQERVAGGCGGRCGNKCECEGGFYEKIVGVKGPKCEKEVEGMEGWINYFMGSGSGGGGERREPLRLAFLLLGKAAFVSGGGDCGFGGIEFPSTIEAFLKICPPKD